jgi:hypothetical protein
MSKSIEELYETFKKKEVNRIQGETSSKLGKEFEDL